MSDENVDEKTSASKKQTVSLVTVLDFVVVLFILALITGILLALTFVDIPEKNETLFAALSGGVVGSSFTAYIQWRWGSSKGSADKDRVLSNMAAGGGQP